MLPLDLAVLPSENYGCRSQERVLKFSCSAGSQEASTAPMISCKKRTSSGRMAEEPVGGMGHPVPAAIQKCLSANFRGLWSTFHIHSVGQQAVVVIFPWGVQKANGWLSRRLQQLTKSCGFQRFAATSMMWKGSFLCTVTSQHSPLAYEFTQSPFLPRMDTSPSCDVETYSILLHFYIDFPWATEL